MRKSTDNAGVASAFEELPAILVVLVAVSLFAVSLAHAAASRDSADDYAQLRDDCLSFAAMVRCSDALCQDGKAGTFSAAKLQNFSADDFLADFNSTEMGIGYSVMIQVIEMDTGNITLTAEVRSSQTPEDRDVATFGTCVSVENCGVTGAARLTVSAWRLE